MSATSSSATALPYAKLVFSERGIEVHSPSEWGIGPVRIEKFCKTVTDAMVHIVGQFLTEHDRCLALVINLDTRNGFCTFGIPRQRAARDASCWQLVREDYTKLTDTTLVIGGLQCRRFGNDERPVDAVPPVDGIYFVANASTAPIAVHSFVRAEGVIRSLPASDLIVDDVAAALEEASSRIAIV